MDDFSPLGDLRTVSRLSLYRYSESADFRFLGELTALRSLDFGRTAEGVGLGIRGGLRRLAVDAPGIKSPGFLYVRPFEELGELARFAALEKLSIHHCQVGDLTPLGTVESLRILRIVTPVDSVQLGQIAGMSQLTTLDILSRPAERGVIDLSGLGDAKLTVRTYADRHRFVGVGPRIKVKTL